MQSREENGDQEAPRSYIFDLERMRVEDAVLLFAAIAEYYEASGEADSRYETMIAEFDVQSQQLEDTNLPRAIELNTAMANSPSAACRYDVALGIYNIAERAPREGLMIWLGLLADPDRKVAERAYESLDPPDVSENFLDEGPPIEASTVRELLKGAYKLFRTARADPNEPDLSV
jgi:hypothetical protein